MANKSYCAYAYVIAALAFVSLLIMTAYGLVSVVATALIAGLFTCMLVITSMPRSSGGDFSADILKYYPGCIMRLSCPELKLRWANMAAERFFAVEMSELEGKSLESLNFGGDAGNILESVNECLRSAKTVQGCCEVSPERRLMFIAAPIFARGSVSGIILSINDVSLQYKMQLSISELEHLKSTQRVAGGVAHEFNNLLQIVVGYAELLQDGDCDAESSAKFISQICQAGKRGSRIVRKLMAFSSQGKLEDGFTDVDNYIRKLLGSLGCLLGEKVQASFTNHAEKHCVDIHPAVFERILVCLCLNAAEAMDNNGSVHIVARNVHVDSNYICGNAQAKSGDYLVLDICDDGCGVIKEKHNLVFEPFYSTASECVEKGMGLSVSYGLVRSCGGWIEIDSSAGGPSCFSIFLPLSGAENSVHTGSEFAADATVSRITAAMKVLVCQDDPFMGRLICAAIESMGHHCYVAADGNQAMGILTHIGSQLDMLVIDPVLPAVNACKIRRTAAKYCGSIHTVFASSLDCEITTGQLGQSEPFSMLGLIGLVRRAMAKQSIAQDNGG